MTPRSASAATATLSLLLFAFALPAQTTDAASSTTGVSKIRIVRLSENRGSVQMDRNIGRGFEPAVTNMPIVEGSSLRTDAGTAEVEFEDNSSLRLATNTAVEFPQLSRASTGTASSIRLLKGTVYMSLLKSKGNEFNIQFGKQTIELQPASHVRVQMDADEAMLAVLDGSVRVDGPAGSQEISRKETATFHLADQQAPTVAKNVEQSPFDAWDKQSVEYHSRVASMSAFNSSSSPYAYGMNDLAYYGTFMDAGGCGGGMMWRPYFVSASWDPYSNGVYAWYPGAGYSWVSPYPWGWMPYHYGSWSFCPGMGWGWLPGGTWTGLPNTGIMMTRMGSAPGHIQPAPVNPPKPGEPTLTAVNLRPLVHSQVSSGDSFVFRNDSAGMGIPRNELGKLDKLSHDAEAHGTSTTQIYISAAPSGTARGTMPGGLAPASIHRGTPPSQGPAFNGGAAVRGPGGNSGNTYSSPSPSPTRSAPAPTGGGSRPH
ncbi:MAG TPA: FecR family protein [Terracidiphilus sp.]|nr:FecR family protein [Terracidiphilus sp.]